MHMETGSLVEAQMDPDRHAAIWLKAHIENGSYVYSGDEIERKP